MRYAFRLERGHHGGPDELGPATSDRFDTLEDARRFLGDSKAYVIVTVDAEGSPTSQIVHRTYPFYRASDSTGWMGPVRSKWHQVWADRSRRAGAEPGVEVHILATPSGGWGVEGARAICLTGEFLCDLFWLPEEA